ncbi:unnamed protein product [Allacma fusca]|uniref:Uncharacterized protein n=1 Tax=Allacma fusca TaxID=39272 RepID=A0A8J2L0A5_9HEXA|nr:unnamed protein product [Allacma fusca]
MEKYLLEKNLFHEEHKISEHFHLSLVIISLFNYDKMIYDEFNDSLEPLFQNALQNLVQKINSQKQPGVLEETGLFSYDLGPEVENLLTKHFGAPPAWNIFEILTNSERKSRLNEFQTMVIYCKWKPQWATDLMELINSHSTEGPSTVTYTNNESESLYEPDAFATYLSSYIHSYYKKNPSKEELEQRYWREIMDVWGIDEFIAALHFRDYFGLHYWCYRFKDFLAKILMGKKYQGRNLPRRRRDICIASL